MKTAQRHNTKNYKLKPNFRKNIHYYSTPQRHRLCVCLLSIYIYMYVEYISFPFTCHQCVVRRRSVITRWKSAIRIARWQSRSQSSRDFLKEERANQLLHCTQYTRTENDYGRKKVNNFNFLPFTRSFSEFMKTYSSARVHVYLYLVCRIIQCNKLLVVSNS